MEVSINISSSFTEVYACFSGPLTLDLTFLQHEKWNGSNKTLFLSLLRFAKHLRLGNHLLLACKQAKRTEQERKSLASWPHQLAPVSARPPPQRCTKPRPRGSGKHFEAGSLFCRTKRNSCREQGW